MSPIDPFKKDLPVGKHRKKEEPAPPVEKKQKAKKQPDPVPPKKVKKGKKKPPPGLEGFNPKNTRRF